MARNKLTAKGIEASDKTMLSDGDGLYLRRSKSGTRSWVFVYFFDGRRREIGLGSYGGGTSPVSIAVARKKADVVRAQLADGIDPLAARAKERGIPTFGEMADAFIEKSKPGWTNDKHLYQWETTLSDAYCASIRSKRVDAVTTEDILAIIKPLWSTKQETGSRLRMRIEKVLDFAKTKGHRTGDNPAVWRGHFEHLLPKRDKLAKTHLAAAPYAEVPAIVAKLNDISGVGAQALRFTILTASRSNEVFNAVWSEFDLEGGVWEIPKERMKAKRPHRVPLTPGALDILRIRLEKRSSDYVFPGYGLRRPISNMTMTAVLRGITSEYTVHGFRSSFRDFAYEETDHPREIAEAALAHAVGDATEQAYKRGDALKKRLALMLEWEKFVLQIQD